MKRYKEFSTEDADYRLNYGIHDKTSKVDNLEDYDGIVLESGANSYEEWEYKALYADFQYGEIIRKNRELDEPKPIFFVDLPLHKFLRERGRVLYLVETTKVCLSIAPYLAVGELMSPFFGSIIAITLCLSGYTLPHKIPDKFAYLEAWIAPFDGYRSVVSALKIKNFITSELKERIKHKPYIFIEYGAGHSSIEIYLKHPKLAKIYKKCKFLGIWYDNSYLNLVHEFRNLNSKEPSPFGKERIIKRWSEFKEWERILYNVELK